MASPTHSIPDESSDPGAALTAPGAPYALQTLEIDGVPQRVFRTAPQTLAEAYRGLADYAGRELCVSGEQRLSYGEILCQAGALASHLATRHQIGRGARVAIIMHNCPEWLVAFLAVTAAGATAVLINNRGTAGEIAAALDDTDTCAVIADAARARLINNGHRRRPLIAAGAIERGIAATPFADAIADWENSVFTPIATSPDDEALVMFTSGTTGGAKATLLSQRNVLTGLMNIQFSMAVIGARIGAAAAPVQPSALLAVPLFHASGCYTIFLSNLLRGGRIVMLPKWNAERALDLIAGERILAFSGPPSMLWDLVRAQRGARDLRCLWSIGIASQGFQPRLLQEARAAFPHAVIGRGYGMTEANGSICLIAGDELLRRPTSSGRVIATADIKLVDENGADVNPGEAGEICVRGAMVMRGYCKRPEQTAVVLRDGWLFTGDLGRLDADGYLYIIDRKKDIIISGGDKISCSEVEAVVLDHPAIDDAAVFALADDRLGEIAALAVVLKPDCAVEAYALKNHVAAQLAIYKVPRLVMYCSELPRNIQGKIIRQELQRRFVELRPRYRTDTDTAAVLLAHDGMRRDE